MTNNTATRITRKPRACVPCHERKVRCNANEVGTPCTRCRQAARTASCVLLRPFKHCHGVRQNSTSQWANTRVDTLHPLGGAHTETIDETDTFRSPLADLAASSTAIELQTPKYRSDGQELNLPFDIANQHKPSELRRDDYSAIVEAHPDPRPSIVNILTPETASQHSAEKSALEDDATLEICRELTQQNVDFPLHDSVPYLGRGREVLEYHDTLNSITILSKALGNQRPRKLVRLILRDSKPGSTSPQDFGGLSSVDLEFLQKKSAFFLPSPSVCERLFRIFFECVYPYTPILDRVGFLYAFENRTYSIFLLQCVFANVVPYASPELLQEAGFPDRRSAQQGFFNRARLLYDFGVEKRQLPLLQGCLSLSLVQCSFAIEKDFRFWLSTAMRIATNMGLHRDEMARSLEPHDAKLFRRIWWVLYHRDLTNAFSGLDNVKRSCESTIDTSDLIIEDWDEEDIPARFVHVLSPVTMTQKNFLVASSKLSRIAAKYIDAFRSPGKSPCRADVNNILEALRGWRNSLPKELQVQYIEEWNIYTFWPLVLMARFHHFECIFFRNVKDFTERLPGELISRATESLRVSMFELDTILDRIMLHDVARYCPLYLNSCASTVLALHIEIALDPTVNKQKQLLSRKQLHTGLTYLRNLSDSWLSMPWYLRLQEAILESNSLLLVSQAKNSANPLRSDQFARSEWKGGPQGGLSHRHDNSRDRNAFMRTDGSSNGDDPQAEFPISEAAIFNPSVPFELMSGDDPFFSSANSLRAEDWLQNIFSSNLPV